MPVRTFDTRTWLFLPDTDLWEETPTKKSKIWIVNLLPLFISIISLFLSHVYKLFFMCFLLSLFISLSAAHWGVLLYSLIEVKMWCTYNDTSWEPTKKCVDRLNVQKVKEIMKKEGMNKFNGCQCPSRQNICFIFKPRQIKTDTYMTISVLFHRKYESCVSKSEFFVFPVNNLRQW